MADANDPLPLERWHERLQAAADRIGNVAVDLFHTLALFAIGMAVVWSAVKAFLNMTEDGHATIEDILLLFIYLELGAMVGIYFRTRHMPVRFLVYVAITALTRMMVGHIGTHHVPDPGILMISGAILVLAVAVLVLRYGSFRFPSTASAGTAKDAEARGEGRSGVSEV